MTKRTMPADAEYPVLQFAGVDAWQHWLEANHATARGVWLRIAKKSAAVRSVTYGEAVDVALCWGWIDGQARKSDDDTYLQKFTPRGARSIWSNINREKVEALLAAGRMQPAGLAAVAAAKADGRWERAYYSPRTSTMPDDFAAALTRRPGARPFFDSLSSAQRYAFLYRIQTAVRPETRTRRIEQFADMLERGETLR